MHAVRRVVARRLTSAPLLSLAPPVGAALSLRGFGARQLSSETDLAKTLAADPAKLEAFLSALPPATKKQVGVTWALAEIEDEFAKADKNADGTLSYGEFKTWAEMIIRSSGPQQADVPVTNTQLQALAIQNSIPYVGFGCVDNSLMILSGDLIDGTLGVVFGLSTLAAAALGNAFSNSLGMVLHGTIERFAEKLGLPDPRLTVSQREAASVKNVRMVSGIFGVLLGCLLGMFPLLFMNAHGKAEERQALKRSASQAG